MAALVSVFAIVVLSLLITRFAVLVLVVTGLSRESSRFQARSALTGSGFTTSEALELEYPLQVVEYGLIDGSQGAGTQPGGRGIRRRIRILSEGTVVEYNGTRIATRPGGASGGQAAGPGRCWIERPDGRTAGVGAATPGGGGFGGA
jgi:N-methylhydantoinase B/oxoprolinase/acetone carboxylase alpha subunit